MTSMFDSNVRARRNHTEWARISLPHLMKDLALEGADARNHSLEGEVSLRCHSRPGVASGYWWTLEWVGPDGQRRRAEAQDLQLALWRAAEIQVETRAKDSSEGTPPACLDCGNRHFPGRDVRRQK